MNILNKVTLQSLKKNKVRTIVTIIGIILSTAMFTAVTTSISSIRNYMIESIISEDGNWEGMALGISAEDFKKLAARDDIKSYGGICEFGYLSIKDAKKNSTESIECYNDSKPYLLMAAMTCDDKTASELMHFTLLSGRMPENPYEILVPEHLALNGGVYLKIGDTITGSIGQREYQGNIIFSDEYYKEADADKNDPGEKLVQLEKEQTYTVVGTYERFNYYVENHSCAGYTVLVGESNPLDAAPDARFHFIFSLKNRNNIFKMDGELEQITDQIRYHNDLLRMDGLSKMSSYTTVFMGLAIILCIIIVFGSVALIYNAFSISVNERIKQFGLLASVGATKRQRKKSIMFEACVVSAAGIPLGILAGILGMGITFYALRYRFSGILNDAKIPLTLKVEWWTVLVAAALAFLTVLVSAAIPARKAMRIPVIEAIRQNNEIRVPNKKLHTPRFLYKLFGMEGTLADKNFRRNRRKYRATVISLFVSIVLFISASSFVDYLKSGVNATVLEKNYDFLYYTYNIENSPKAEDVLKLFEETEGVKESSIYSYDVISYIFPKETLTEEMLDWIEERGYLGYVTELYKEQFGDHGTAIQICVGFISDENYRNYTEKNNLTEKGYFGDKKNALVYDNVRKYLNGRYFEIPYLKEQEGILPLLTYEWIEEEVEVNSSDNDSQKEGGSWIEYQYHFVPGEQKNLSYYVTDAPLPLGVDKEDIVFLYPESALLELFPEITDPVRTINIKASGNTDELYAKLQQKLIENGIATGQFYDVAEHNKFERNMLLIINVFSFGFIALISLIAAANVFNTISTNISLRRREFAMLESIGMTRKGLYKMLNYECLLYGIKSLVYGMPVALLVTFAIYQVVNEGFATSFYVPAASVIIAVFSVFAVVFATMFYAAGKLKKNSLVETLKNENV